MRPASSLSSLSEIWGGGSCLAIGLGLLFACSGPPDGEETASTADTTAGGQSSGVEAPDSLSEAEWQKLDHALKLLLQEGPDNPLFTYQTGTREERAVYGVLIRTSDPEALTESELPLGKPTSEVITARLTCEEIRKATRLKAIVSISNPSEAELH